MATAELIHAPPALPRRAARTASRSAQTPTVLAAALLLLLTYAAFAHGAVGSTAEARLQVALAAVAALAGGAWLWSGTLRIAAPRLALAAIALLAAFAVWSGISLLWSVAPDQTWLELNRALTYLLALSLAVALGASHRRAVETVAKGFLLIVLAVTIYALGQKLFPGLHVAGLFNLNQTGPLSRLQEPFGYWNALALFVCMGVPIALMLTVDRMRPRSSRLGALVALELMLLTVVFTYSRGGLLALIVALTLAVLMSKAALRALMWLAIACLAAVPPAIVGLTDHALTASNVRLGSREGAGALLALALLVSLLALIAGGWRLLELEWRVHLTPERTRAVRRGVLAAAGAAVMVSLLAASLSSRGLDGTVSHAWKSFTTTRASSISDPHHLLSADSENRWVWWKEAAGAFSDRPIAGWGAGSFGVLHLLYRRDLLTVRQPHSVPLQWLAETGAVGALLALVGFGALLTAAGRVVRERPLSTERLLGLALLAGGAAYAVHALYDWDWDIPGVTLPALLLLGVLAGSAAPAARRHPLPVPGPSLGTRTVALALLALALCTFALSATLRGLAQSKASSALVMADNSSSGSLTRAQASAALASRLDPVSDAGPRAEATIAQRRGHLRLAQSYLLDAVRREPSDAQAWLTLVGVDVVLNDLTGAQRADTHAMGLDPLRAATIAKLVQPTFSDQTPARGSATATPLP